ncbi:MAG TPA: beta-eliminating lyase-related protein, partial [Gaiella sp.]|nr:beta-eliminating lyase-related protein [Gaiella sp.]
MTDAAAAVDDKKRYRAAVAGAERFLNAWHGLPGARAWLESLAVAADERERGDRYGEGERVEQLERRTADLLGREAAVFMPSGTMAQQIAMRIWCER